MFQLTSASQWTSSIFLYSSSCCGKDCSSFNTWWCHSVQLLLQYFTMPGVYAWSLNTFHCGLKVLRPHTQFFFVLFFCCHPEAWHIRCLNKNITKCKFDHIIIYPWSECMAHNSPRVSTINVSTNCIKYLLKKRNYTLYSLLCCFAWVRLSAWAEGEKKHHFHPKSIPVIW